nr:hypothetical protein Iba_chr07eCG2480 [Ipomoea batatas]
MRTSIFFSTSQALAPLQTKEEEEEIAVSGYGESNQLRLKAVVYAANRRSSRRWMPGLWKDLPGKITTSFALILAAYSAKFRFHFSSQVGGYSLEIAIHGKWTIAPTSYEEARKQRDLGIFRRSPKACSDLASLRRSPPAR